ncbi:MAG TPA: TerB family tellurite resistance protein [Brumimicrobium sp.]|nr:TerB family tellurite resistance protein [Brumimicrobium sp.]
MIKWIAAFIGYYLSDKSFFGAIIGFFIGSFIGNALKAGKNHGQEQRSSRFANSDEYFNYYQRQTQRFDFPTMLVALSAVIMKADNRVMKSELNYVKTYLKQQFGDQFTSEHLQTLRTFIDNPHNIPLSQICYDIKLRTSVEIRVQLLHYLFGIAKADGEVSQLEMRELHKIADLLGVPNMDFTSVQNMYQRDTDSDYKVLGIDKTVSDDEVKKAYRKMAVRYHPDKVATMGEEYQKGAKEKFQKVQEAYENIKKERAM